MDEANGGRELVSFIGHAGPVLAVAFSPDGTRVLSGSSDRTARIWSTKTGREMARWCTDRGEFLSCWFTSGRSDEISVVDGAFYRLRLCEI